MMSQRTITSFFCNVRATDGTSSQAEPASDALNCEPPSLPNEPVSSRIQAVTVYDRAVDISVAIDAQLTMEQKCDFLMKVWIPSEDYNFPKFGY